MSLSDILTGPGLPLQLDVLLVEHGRVGGEGGGQAHDVVADDGAHPATDPHQPRRPVSLDMCHNLMEGRVGDVVEAKIVAPVGLETQTGVLSQRIQGDVAHIDGGVVEVFLLLETNSHLGSRLSGVFHLKSHVQWGHGFPARLE